MIKIKKGSELNTIPLSTLPVGATFLDDGQIYMVASRNGHPFVLNVATGKDSSISMNNTVYRVCPVQCELSYFFE